MPLVWWRQPFHPQEHEMLNLKDPSLLREQCFIDGQWVGAEQTIEVSNPATGQATTATGDAV